jgi:hypothetical protein
LFAKVGAFHFGDKTLSQSKMMDIVDLAIQVGGAREGQSFAEKI